MGVYVELIDIDDNLDGEYVCQGAGCGTRMIALNVVVLVSGAQEHTLRLCDLCYRRQHDAMQDDD